MTEVPPLPTFKQKTRRLRAFWSAGAFIGGVVWDVATLGRRITSLDLFILLAYLLAAAAILFALGRNASFRFSEHLNFALQFLFGGIFSALMIFYFLSASAAPGYAVVIILAVLLAGNEFLEKRYSQLTLSWTLFALCTIMFSNFALPHLFRSISSIWFYLSSAVAMVLVVLLSRTSKREDANIAPAFALAVLLIIAHAANLIPPVPLVKKQMVIAHALTRKGSRYEMRVERPPAWKFWQTSSNVVHWRAGNRIYCFTSVFVPRGIKTNIRHAWDYRDPRTSEWKTTTSLTFPIAGGREGGFRGYTFKANLTPGEWRVRAESESGATLGILRFTVAGGAPGRLRRLVL